ncbi:MAG: carbohydrate binding domain-containing protein [Oscillospiraceae bacterium]|nr:carbohydrate binding domain-containing protein [Oscillospiraceae bacterium]
MKRLISSVTAFAVTACMLPMLPQMSVNAGTNDEILADQLSMPIVSIDTLGNSVSSKESYTNAKVTIYDENGTIDTDNADISIRLRGNNTLNVAKKSYKFKFPKKANPLSLGDGAAKSWNLVAKSHAEYLAEWLDQRIIWLNTYFTSDDWNGGTYLDESGTYLDENGKSIDPDNAVAVSTLMFWDGTGEIDVDSPGFTAEASSGGWDGQAIAAGVMLFKGQKYKLSFDYTAPDTASINYRIQANHDNYKAYMSGTVKPDESKHFEQSLPQMLMMPTVRWFWNSKAAEQSK